MQEIERKYLVHSDEFRREAFASVRIAQGYLCRRRVTARIRLRGDEAFLTIKGRSRDGGLSRFEWERRIPATVAERLLARCRGRVEKVRHLVRFGGTLFEVDEFAGDNAGLIVAEAELPTTDFRPQLPPWIWKEVTGNPFYYNSFLAEHPYREWGPQSEVFKR